MAAADATISEYAPRETFRGADKKSPQGGLSVPQRLPKNWLKGRDPANPFVGNLALAVKLMAGTAASGPAGTVRR
ncbi:hypothetical protein Ate01nite_36100 [Actinoplanes teichomyceticus]|nr:hypothetical protein Ate01nite_36100 [Actinoplanes teichomyceticus]